jgi:hypothetical protein
MNTAEQYARALFSLVAENPRTGGEFFEGLKQALKKRGHDKLLPRILHEYERLAVAQERSAQAREETPERERTRILFELYKKLTS